MRIIDIDGLLLPENYDEIQEKSLNYKTGFKKQNLFRFDVVEWRQPKPVKKYTQDEIKLLEDSMRKEGKL